MSTNGHNTGQNNSSVYRDPDTFDMRGFMRAVSDSVRHHKLLMICVCLLTVALAIAYARIFPPIYEANAVLAAERELDPPRDTFFANWEIFRKNDARDEKEFITAGEVLKEAVDKNHLTYDDVYHPFMSEVSYLWEQSWPGRTYINLKNRLFPDKDAPSKSDMQLGRIIVDMKAGINVTVEQDTHIAKMTVKGPSRRVAAIANTILDAYLKHRSEWNSSEARQSFNALTEEADRARAAMKQIGDQRVKFDEGHGLLLDFQEESQDIKQLTDLETQIANNKVRIAATEASLAKVEDQLEKEPVTNTVSRIQELNAVRENARIRQLDLQASLISLRDRYREDSPEVKEVKDDLAKLDALVASEPEKLERGTTLGLNALHTQLTGSRDQLQSDLAGARASVSLMDKDAAVLRAKLADLPATMTTSHDYDREYGVAAEKYQQLMLKRIQAEVSITAATLAPASVRVVDYAMPPAAKYWPKAKYLYPGALLTGLLLGMIAAFLRSVTSGKLLRSHIEAGAILSPVYATVNVVPPERPLVVFKRDAAGHIAERN